MKQQLLLLEDVDSLGRKGELVTAKPGYIRNYLLPKRLAVIATQNMLRKQEKLQKEREEQAVVDRKVSEELAERLKGQTLETKVKVDPEGHMYGSVSPNDIVALFEEKGFAIERKYLLLTKPIKVTGLHTLSLRLKEGIEISCQLHIIPDGVDMRGVEAVTKPIVEEGTKDASSALDSEKSE